MLHYILNFNFINHCFSLTKKCIRNVMGLFESKTNIYLAYIKSNFIQFILKLYNDSLSFNDNLKIVGKVIVHFNLCIFIAYFSISVFNKIK